MGAAGDLCPYCGAEYIEHARACLTCGRFRPKTKPKLDGDPPPVVKPALAALASSPALTIDIKKPPTESQASMTILDAPGASAAERTPEGKVETLTKELATAKHELAVAKTELEATRLELDAAKSALLGNSLRIPRVTDDAASSSRFGPSKSGPIASTRTGPSPTPAVEGAPIKPARRRGYAVVAVAGVVGGLGLAYAIAMVLGWRSGSESAKLVEEKQEAERKAAVATDTAAAAKITAQAAADAASALPRALPDDLAGWMPKIRADGDPQGRFVHLRASGIARGGKLDPATGEVEAMFLKEMPVEAPGSGSGSSELPLHCFSVKRNAADWVPVDKPWCSLWRTNKTIAPRCTLRTIWEFAIVDGAPPDALARIMHVDGAWYFSLGEVAKPTFSKTYPDLCQEAK